MRARAILLSALALTACALPPEAIEPTVEVPGAFSAGGDVALPAAWWTTLGDPELDRSVARALSGNLTLRAAWARLDQARAVARRADAATQPTLEAGASASRTVARTEVTGPLGTSREIRNSTGLSAGLTAGYEIDLWGRVRSAREAAALDARATEQDLRAAALTLAARVAETWIRIRIQAGQIELLERQIETNEKVLEVVTLRFRSGRVGAEDVLRQRQLVEARRGEIVAARATLETLEHQLCVLEGVPPTRGRPVDPDGLGELPPLPATGLPAEVVDRRPDVRAAWFRAEAASRRVTAAVADRYPAIRLTGRLETSGDEVGDLFRNWLGSLAAGLAAPLLDGGRREAEEDRTRAVVAERLETYGAVVLEALEEVETALVTERRQRETIANLERRLALSEDVLARIRDAYTRGAHDYLRVLDGLASSQALQRSLLTARGRLVLDRIALCRAIAGAPELTRPGAQDEEPADEGDRE